jgi:hypothetical protein
MADLYPADRHCALRDEARSADKVGAGIRKILQHSVSSFERGGLWPRHPLDGDGPSRTDYYFGAGGVFWGVSLLSREGWIDEPQRWFSDELEVLVRRNVEERGDLDLDSSRSFLFGDIPLLMLLYVHEPTAALGDQIFARLESALAGPVHELMWGMAGCMLATLHMHAATDQERWVHLYQRQASRLVAAGQYVPGVGYHWLSERRGTVFDGLGAVHGFAGNVTSLLQGFRHLTEEAKSRVSEHVPRTLVATAVRHGGRANWPRSTGTKLPFRGGLLDAPASEAHPRRPRDAASARDLPARAFPGRGARGSGHRLALVRAGWGDLAPDGAVAARPLRRSAGAGPPHAPSCVEEAPLPRAARRDAAPRRLST